jgi:hypothetical protein
LWLATTSGVGDFIGDLHKGVHYEITDIVDPTTGRKGNNFRLALSTDPDDSIPDEVLAMPSPCGQREGS